MVAAVPEPPSAGTVSLQTGRETELPLAGAIVDLRVRGPESRALETGASGSDGFAEATWETAAPGEGRKGGEGTATGSHAVQVTGVTASGHAWDRVGVEASFTDE